MRIVDLIEKKKQGLEHTQEEISFIVDNYTKNKIDDYQVSAWLMAVCFQGLSDRETAYLTKSFIDSGETLDFSSISPHIADKHSTGGVGDKVTLVLIPILAALDIYSAKLSGRGLGFTGGTIDKLESIPGFRVELTNEEFLAQIKKVKAAISSQSPNLTPADAKFYALRDVTATVDNKSLICASVVSKKIASGATSIVLDVKYGSGAFLKTKKEAEELGDLMVRTAKLLNKDIDIVISSMDCPLGKCIGNSLEVIEAIEFLKGNYETDLYETTKELAIKTILNCKKAPDSKTASKLFDEVIKNKTALNKLKEIIEAQKGDTRVIDDYSFLPMGKNKTQIKSEKQGVIKNIDALKIAKSAKLLGAGRDKKSDKINYGAGIKLYYKNNDSIEKDSIIMELFWDDIPKEKLTEAIESAKSALEYK